MANKSNSQTDKDPREPQVDESPGKGDFAERTQDTNPWAEANERERSHARPDSIVVPQGERRSEPLPEKPAKKTAKKSSSSKKSK